jgi:predicted transcriptional regulator
VGKSYAQDPRGALWVESVHRSRDALAEALAGGGLEQTTHDGMSLRRLLADLIEEYAPHDRNFVYDFGMRKDEVTEDMIEGWVAEAEAGYDVEELKRRGRGRPGRGSEPMLVVAVRLTADEVAALDALAEREHVTRSEAIRRALANFAA